MRTHETVENMSGALESVQRPKSEIYPGVPGVSVLRTRKCVKCGRQYLVPDRLCLVLRQTCKGVERAEAAVTFERSLA